MSGREESDSWSGEAKLAVVIETAGMNPAELSEYCRNEGLSPEQVEAWREACIAGAEIETRLREAEQAKAQCEREAADIYEEMFHRNTAPKLLIDPETGAIVDANPAALAFYGYSLQQIRQKYIQDINQLSEAQVKADWEKARREERRYFEFRHRLANGEIRDVKVYSGPMEIGGRIYLHSIIHDVTDSRRHQKNLERYKAIFDTLPVGVYRNRPGTEGPFEETNPAMARIFGARSVAELQQHTTAELYRDPEERRRFSEELLTHGEVYRRELDLQTLDGRPIRAAITARVRYAEDGSPVFDGVVEDVTEQHRAERFRRRLLESLAEGVFGIDEEGRFSFLNPVACRLLGFANEAEALGRNAHGLIHHSLPDGTSSPESATCPIEDVQRTGEPLEAYEDCFWRQDGTGFPVQLFASPLLSTDGRPEGVVVAFSDISERKTLEQSLLKYRTAFEQSRDAVMFLDRDHFLEGNPATLAMFGFDSVEAFRHCHPTDLAPPTQPDGRPSVDAARDQIEEAFEHGQAFFEWQCRSLEGEDFPTEVMLSRIDHAQQPLLQAVVRDVTSRKAAEKARDEVLAILDATPDLVAANRPDGRVTYINRGGMKLLGVDAEGTGLDAPLPETWTSWQNALEGAHPEWARQRILDEGIPAAERHGVWHGETAVLDAEAREVPVSQIILAHTGDDGTVSHYSTIMRDISERKAMEEELERLATHDPLTGLYNRTGLYEHLEQARMEHERYGTPFSLIMFDIDRFKDLNDRFGHPAGDAVLRELAHRMNAALRATDVQARWGGEEFLVLATHTETEGAAELAERLRQNVAQRDFEGVGRVTISLGVATIRAGESIEYLERRVDEALYAAKAAGRNQVIVAEAKLPT